MPLGLRRDGAALWALARPAMLPLVLTLPLLGLFLAHWDRALAMSPRALGLLWVWAGWASLHVGSLWTNAALDRDEGELLLGRAVPVPAGTRAWGNLALVFAPILALGAGSVPAALAALGAALAWAYSHPKWAWKAHPLGGPLVNALGYGVLSPWAGWALSGQPPTARGLATLALLPPLMLALYFSAQAFQGEEDAARGYRTLVAVYGAEVALTAARIALATAFAGFALLCAVGWLPLAGLGALGGAWIADRHLRRWGREGGSAADARKLLQILLFTFVFELGAVAQHYAVSVWAGGPTAGLATRAGWPPDRAEVRARRIAKQLDQRP